MIQSVPVLAALAVPLEASLEAVIVVDEADRIIYANPAACRVTGYALDELLGTDAYRPMPPDARAGLQAAIRHHDATQPLGTILRGTSTMTRRDGERYEIEFAAAPLMLNERCLVSIMFHDVTEMRRMARRVEALSEIASQVAIADSLDTTLSRLAKSVVRATGTVACAVFLLDERGDFRLTADGRSVWASYGLPDDPALETKWMEVVRRGGGPSLDPVREQRPLIYTGARTMHLSDPVYEPLYPYLRDAPWETAVALPMVYRNTTIGILNVFYPRGTNPGPVETAFLTTIAGQAAVAVENSRLFVEAKEKAVLEERQRIARELHDSVSQALYGIALGAQTARTLLERDPAQAGEPLDYALALAEAGLAEMRALIFELRPEALATEGLLAALHKQIDSIRARHGVAIDTEWDGEPEVPYDTKETLYRIVQEALHMIATHARARHVHLRIRESDEGATLEIRHDGRVPPAGETTDHPALRSMRKRAAGAGGVLELENRPDGTVLRASIPRRDGPGHRPPIWRDAAMVAHRGGTGQ